MKTQGMMRVLLCALAAGFTLVGIGAPLRADSRNDLRPAMPLNGWNGRLGPGIGSTKAPFGVMEVGRSVSGDTDQAMYFHASDGQAVQQVPTIHMGPGPWSVKAATSGWYNESAF